MAAQGGTALLGAYLAVGADELKQRHALERLDARLARAGGDPDFNRDEIDGSNSPDPAMLRSTLDTLPFGSEFRLVVVKGVDRAPKALTEEIVSYLANPCPTTVLFMTAAKLPKGTRLYKAVAKLGEKAVLDCTPKKRWELPRQVEGMVRSRGGSIDPEAAEELVRLVGESTTMLDNEAAKLVAALGGRAPIGVADVRRLVPRIAEVKPWDFLDAVCRRDAALAMRLWSQMPNQSPFGLFSLAVTRLRELIAAKALASRGRSSDLASELGLQAWQVKNHAAWARNFTMGELVGALRAAVDAEAALKSSPDKELVLQRWVLSLCAPRATASPGQPDMR